MLKFEVLWPALSVSETNKYCILACVYTLSLVVRISILYIYISWKIKDDALILCNSVIRA